MSATTQQQYQSQTPPQASQQASNGPINDADVKMWTDRLNDVLARPSEHLNSKSPEGSQSWFAGFFDCFNPIDTCLISWCLPCVTFGRAHHRMHKDPELNGYEFVNTSVSDRLKYREQNLLISPTVLGDARRKLCWLSLCARCYAAPDDPREIQP